MAQSTPWRSHHELALTTSWTRASSSPSSASAPPLPWGAPRASSMGPRTTPRTPRASAAADKALSARGGGPGRSQAPGWGHPPPPRCHGACRSPGASGLEPPQEEPVDARRWGGGSGHGGCGSGSGVRVGGMGHAEAVVEIPRVPDRLTLSNSLAFSLPPRPARVVRHFYSTA